jgi:site-specific DNA recombinase
VCRSDFSKELFMTTFFLGYDTNEDGETVVDEEQAEVVRRIFREFL